MSGKRLALPILCQYCGVEFYGWRRSQRFCSSACFGKAEGGDAIRRLAQATVMERFWIQVDTSGDCWLWTGTTVAAPPRNYGQYGRNGKHVLAHRAAWEMVAGAIPEGMHALHTCDNPPCVRNDDVGIYIVRGVERQRRGHLWLGTSADNMADMADKGRAANPIDYQTPEKRRALAVARGIRSGEVRRQRRDERRGICRPMGGTAS